MPNGLLPHGVARDLGDGEIDLGEAVAGFGDQDGWRGSEVQIERETVPSVPL